MSSNVPLSRSLIHITEVHVLLISLVLKSVDEIGISSAQSGRSQHLVFLLILALQVKSEVNDSGGHTSITSEVNTPCDMVPWRIPVEEYLRAYMYD